MRTKAGFKALRELVGISQKRLADELEVRVLSVKRWEREDNDWMPPQDAWDVLDAAREDQKQVVNFALKKIKEIESDAESTPGAVHLTYWRSAEDYDQAHPGEGENWQMANANSRLVWHALTALGYACDFDFSKMKDQGPTY